MGFKQSKEKFLAALEKENNVKRQKVRTGDHKTSDTAVFKWFLSLRSQNVPLSGAIIQEKANQHAKELSIENFKASDGWLRRWKERNNVTFKTISGESNSVTPEMVNALLYNYDLTDIYNADKFGLFYQYVSNKTYQLKSEKCSGGKLSKVRITGMASANAAGDKLPMFVIGKARKPSCFKNVKFLPCR